MTPTYYAEPTTVLITGATDGIGRALAQQYAARNVRLVLVGKRPHAEVAASDADLYSPHRYCQADLRDPPCATQTITRFLAERAITRLDVLLHNAGIGWYGPLAAQPIQSIDELLAVNLVAPMHITHALLPLVQRVRGTLVLVSSIAADLPSPDYPVYCASKAALDGFARSLRIELGDTARVLVVHPGPTRTAIHAKSGIPTSPARLQRYPAAAWVARRTIAAIEQQRNEATPGALFQLVRQLGRHTRLPDTAYMLARKQGTPRPHLPRPALAHPLCIITGAAEGIGQALAVCYRQAGYAILGIDHNPTAIATARAAWAADGHQFPFILADVGNQHDLTQIISMVQYRVDLDQPVVLIHNAGINAVGRFADVTFATQQQVLDVNLRAPLVLTIELLQRNLLAAGSSIVYISSLSYYVSYPGAAGYAASKSGLAHFGRSARLALAAQGIHVLTVFPGPTRTAHARRYSPDNRHEQRRMPPTQLATLIMAAQQARQAVLVPGLANRLLAAIGQTVPAVTEWGMRQTILNRLPHGEDR